MSWIVELEPSGLFVVKNEVGRPMFDGAFRVDLPWSLKQRMAMQIAAVPEMIKALRAAAQTIDDQAAMGSHTRYLDDLINRIDPHE